ncbi:hypothetical protein GCM10027186_54920 [Micromonospora schwarzwaldensis]
MDPATAGRCGRTFRTSIKAALNGPHAPPPGRVSVAPLALRLRPRNTPGGWRGSGKPKGPPKTG